MPSVQARNGYFGTESILSVSDEISHSSHDPRLRPCNAEAILALTNATLLPSEPYRAALLQFYTQYLYQVVPILDRDEPGLLLRQTLCFAGSIMRLPDDHPKNFTSVDIYARIKALIFLGIETDMLALLKAYCVLSCWTPLSPHIATMDHPWHWVGVAIRLAIQLGFHKESTHLISRISTQSRNIWWYLFCNDTLQSTCFGRPPMIRIQDFDVTLPSADSVTSRLVSGRPFIQLMMNLNVIAMLASRQQDIGPDKLRSAIEPLQEWISNIPPELALFDQSENRNAHDRWVVEIHIFYFISIILVYLLPGPHRHEVNFLLPIHAWLALTAAVPQFSPQAGSSQVSANEEIELLRLALVQQSAKHRSAKLCLSKIERLQKDHAGKPTIEIVEGRNHDPALAPDSNPNATWCECLRKLFPFPKSISPRMEDLMGKIDLTGTGNIFQAPPFADDISFEWADLNFDSLGFLGNDFNMEEVVQPFET
ncbi:hypothetical protein VE03_08630 [Pseudogymnoascus sp. 23342-1-I1]|nr:hypothetical protein VE03_08630 [Pseudogymnoascus sp. 23342-1-I1]